MNNALKNELTALANEEQSILQSIKDKGELEDDGYHPTLKKLHQRNTTRAKEIIAQHGWPTISSVGEDGSDAIWLIVQHSVLDLEFMQSCIPLLEACVKEDEAKGWQLAFLQDRTLMLQGKAQRYGTQHVLDEGGTLVPYKLQDPERTNEMRLALGLETLEQRTHFLRADRERIIKARKRKTDGQPPPPT